MVRVAKVAPDSRPHSRLQYGVAEGPVRQSAAPGRGSPRPRRQANGGAAVRRRRSAKSTENSWKAGVAEQADRHRGELMAWNKLAQRIASSGPVASSHQRRAPAARDAPGPVATPAPAPARRCAVRPNTRLIGERQRARTGRRCRTAALTDAAPATVKAGGRRSGVTRWLHFHQAVRTTGPLPVGELSWHRVGILPVAGEFLPPINGNNRPGRRAR